MTDSTQLFSVCSRSDAVRSAAEVLSAAGIENPRREARVLLAHALRITPEQLLRDPAAVLDPGWYMALVGRRAGREPLAHIVGRRGFWSLDLAVSRAALIPRPETETLVEAALDALPERGRIATVLDLGTGTGCLLLAILTEFPAALGVGVDIAPEAVRLAADNARRLGLEDRAAFLCGDWGSALGGRFDLVLCNPPYIAASDIESLEPEVARHDPRIALDGGPDGLGAYRRILDCLPRLLNPSGIAVLEIGAGQSDPVSALASRRGFEAALRPDLTGILRALVLRMAAP
jgi:release factor glutamine methyltransferase